MQRACAERVPDVSTEFMVQYDNAAESTITGVRVGLPLPIWNRNQGGIRQAQAQLREAEWNSSRVRVNLEQRYATTFQAYLVARKTVESYTEPFATDSVPPVQQPAGQMSPLEEAAEARAHAQQLFPNELSATRSRNRVSRLHGNKSAISRRAQRPLDRLGGNRRLAAGQQPGGPGAITHVVPGATPLLARKLTGAVPQAPDTLPPNLL